MWKNVAALVCSPFPSTPKQNRHVSTNSLMVKIWNILLQIRRHFLKGRNWKYNSRYWTSALRSSPSQFQWCNNSAAVDPALWLDKQPDNINNTENCAQLFISKKNSTARLSDKHCGVVNAFACQASYYCGLHNFNYHHKKIFLTPNLAIFSIFDLETRFL
jgi:Lectin C-type domain